MKFWRRLAVFTSSISDWGVLQSSVPSILSHSNVMQLSDSEKEYLRR
jgi:hypothetical protein